MWVHRAPARFVGVCAVMHESVPVPSVRIWRIGNGNSITVEMDYARTHTQEDSPIGAASRLGSI
jgi:hypothetical protein